MQKDCLQCSASFEISSTDLEFYKKISPEFSGTKHQIPPPNLCPPCRLQRRLAWRNERHLTKRICDACQRSIVSVHPATHTGPVYCNTCWWDDTWNPLDYGKDIDFNRSFIDQFLELKQTTPQIAIMNDDGISSENCAYCQDFVYGKNCYLCVGTWRMYDSCYCTQCDGARNVVDCDMTQGESELCYECLDCQKLYRCTFLQNAENCSDCMFGFDLKGCKYCFCCFGLRNKEYYIFNEQYTKEEYQEKMAVYAMDQHQNFEAYRHKFTEWIEQFPRKCIHQVNCEDCRGDNLFHCKSVHGFLVGNGEQSRYITRCDSPLHSHDQHNSGKPQWCYDCWTVDESYNVCFSQWTNRTKYSYYCDSCDGSQDLFGCISLKKARHCILNKQYTEEEYKELVPKLIDHMRSTSEWGEFFPAARSPLAYNNGVANEYFPLAKEEALAHSYTWNDAPDVPSDVTKTIPAAKLPNAIADIPDDILNWAIECERTGKAFKIIKLELDFYRQMNLPVPRLHPDERHTDRLQRRNPWQIYDRTCAKCDQSIQTTYAPERPEVVYCEQCYLAEVY